MFGMFKKRTEVQQAIDSMGFEAASQHYASIIRSTIPTLAVLQQFYWEELDAASQGNATAKEFVRKSGVSEEKYKGALDRSNPAVDGPNGPQQLLLRTCMQLFDNEELMVRFRLRLVEILIEGSGLNVRTEDFPLDNESDFERLVQAAGQAFAGQELRKRAFQGNTFAQITLSQLAIQVINEGHVNERYLKERFEFTQMAAESGHAISQFNLASMFDQMIDPSTPITDDDITNLNFALHWFRKAAENGITNSQQPIENIERFLASLDQ